MAASRGSGVQNRLVTTARQEVVGRPQTNTAGGGLATTLQPSPTGSLLRVENSRSHDCALAARRNCRLASAVLVRVVQPRCLPEPRAAPRRSGHRHCWRCLGRWPTPWGGSASPGGAPSQRVSRRTIPGGPRRGSPGTLGGRAAPAGGPSGRPPAPCTPPDAALKQERSSRSIGYSYALTTGGRKGVAAKRRAGAAHRRRATPGAGFAQQAVSRQPAR